MNTITVDYPDKGLTLTLRDGTSDIMVIGEILYRDVYRFDHATIPEGGVIVDIGSNIGAFAVYAARLCPTARIIAYEPEPDNFSLLKQNVEQNGFTDRITIHQKAVSDRRERATITQQQGGSRLSITGTQTPDVPKVECDTVTLADVLAENNIETCDLLKIDTEWSEYQILNAPPEVMRRFTVIVSEIHGVPAPEWKAYITRLELTHTVLSVKDGILSVIVK